MQTIAILRDSDIGENIPAPEHYEERGAARAVVFDTDGNIALLHVTKKNYHKLPGGGIEKGENVATALARELQEEIGCAVENVRELGIIEEYRNKFMQRQVSHCFVASLAGGKGAPDFDAKEIADGFEPIWITLNEAIATLESKDIPKDYTGKFVRMRDLIFLREAQKQIGTLN